MAPKAHAVSVAVSVSAAVAPPPIISALSESSVAVSLASYIGQEIEVRWVFRSDWNGNQTGAYIDDIELIE